MTDPKRLNVFSAYNGLVNPDGTLSNHVNIKIKKNHPDAILPRYMSDGAACFDFFACMPNQVQGKTIYPGEKIIIPTGLSMAIPEGYVLKLFSRSGHGFNHKIRLVNCVGIIDSDYRGEIKIGLINDQETEIGHPMKLTINHGDRVAQGMLERVIPVGFEVVDELNHTFRGEGGFGSTGK